MNDKQTQIIDESGDKYKYGFVTDIAADTAPKGLNADIIRLISAKKGEPEWLLDWRLKAFEFWQTMTEPTWAKLVYDKIDYQDLYYYSAPVQKAAPKSLDEVDPELLDTYAKLGIPLKELAETLSLSPGTTSEAVENMVRAGTLQRSICASDRRAVRIRLSESGRKIITVGQERLDHLTEVFLQDLSPEEKQQLLQLLERFAGHLQVLIASSASSHT